MTAREALRLLEEQLGGDLTAEQVVEAARAEDSPLHPHIFDRTPDEAAESWWLHKAQMLIQSIKVRYNTDEGPLEVRRYLSIIDPERNRRVYRDCEKVALDPIARQLVLTEMRRDIASLRQRYKDFQEFWPLVIALAEEAPV